MAVPRSAAAALPPGGPAFLTSSDLDGARDLVGQVFKPLRLPIMKRATRLAAHTHHAKSGGVPPLRPSSTNDRRRFGQKPPETRRRRARR